MITEYLLREGPDYERVAAGLALLRFVRDKLRTRVYPPGSRESDAVTCARLSTVMTRRLFVVAFSPFTPKGRA